MCQPSNKQLQRTVKRRCGDGASAPFHYALTPRITRQRAAAELRRYAAWFSDRSVVGSMRQSRTVVVAMIAVGAFIACQVAAQPSAPTRQVFVYSTYFEADGMRFESIEALRDYLASAPNDFYNIFIGDCAAKGREEELTRVIFGVLFERLKRRGEERPVDLGVGTIPCP
jgi:hypothetical protein